jgi:hypothetical protein
VSKQAPKLGLGSIKEGVFGSIIVPQKRPNNKNLSKVNLGTDWFNSSHLLLFLDGIRDPRGREGGERELERQIIKKKLQIQVDLERDRAKRCTWDKWGKLKAFLLEKERGGGIPPYVFERRVCWCVSRLGNLHGQNR